MSEQPKKPTTIANAMARGDSRYLSNAGRKGAEVANKNRDIKKTLDDIEAEERKLKILEEELERQRATNEDMFSSDGEDFGVSTDDRDEYRIGPQL